MDSNTRHDTFSRSEPSDRTGSTNLSRDDRRTRSSATRSPTLAAVEFGSGWYHAAAIEAEKGAHAHPYR